MLAPKVTPLQEETEISSPSRRLCLQNPKPITRSSEFSWLIPSRTSYGCRHRRRQSRSLPLRLSSRRAGSFRSIGRPASELRRKDGSVAWSQESRDHAEARELFGSLLEAKGDTAGAALQYSRALELLLVHPNDASPAQPASLYAKVKELAPASPLIAKWAGVFSPKPQAPIPAVETPVSVPIGNEISPETHYMLGVAYKNMGTSGWSEGSVWSFDEGPGLFSATLVS